MSGFGLIKQFPSPGYEVWEDWREYYLDVCEVFMWSEEEVKRFLPDKLCCWALDALNYLPRGFWKTDQRNRAWTLQETLYFFDLRLSNNPQFYEDAFERYLVEKEEYEEAVLQCENDRPVFQSDVVDGEELQRQERTPTSDKKKDVQVKTDIIVKSVMTKKPAKSSPTKRWSAIKAVGFGVKELLEENPKFRDGTRRSFSKLADRLSGVEIVADSNVIGGNRNFNFYGEMEEQITTKTISEDEQFKKMMDRCIARWDNSEKMKIAEQRNKALEEIVFSELGDDATFIHDDFSDDDSFFESDDEDKFYCMDDDVFLPNIRGRHSSSHSLASTPGNELTVGKRCSKSLITLEEISSGPGVPWHFGKWIDVGETAMPHFSVAQKGELATAAENIFSGILIANSSRQGIVSTGSHHFDHISVTRTSEDNSEKLQGSFASFPTDGADCEATKSCGSKAAKANSDGFPELSKVEKLTTPAKFGESFFTRIWEECAMVETDKKENGDSNVAAIDGGNACAFDSGENVVPVQFESSYSKQDNEREQSSDFEVMKAIETDWNQFSIGLSGQEETIKCRREVSCSSSPSLLRGSDDHKSLELEYPELYKLLFRKQKVSRKEKWNKLKTRCYSSRGVLSKRMKKSKNENGGGHPFKHRRKKEELTKLVKLNCLW